MQPYSHAQKAFFLMKLGLIMRPTSALQHFLNYTDCPKG